MESNNTNKKKKGKYSEVFKDTYDKCEKITILKESIEESIKLTKLYLEGHKFDLDKKLIKSNDYNIIITPERTLEAVYKYYIQTNKKNKIGVLNFASGKHPGGGVTKGRGGAQEESLCRISTLYPCLNTEFLNENYYSYYIEKKTEIRDRIIEHISNTSMHVTALEKMFWNNKINVTDDQEVVDNVLVFNRN